MNIRSQYAFIIFQNELVHTVVYLFNFTEYLWLFIISSFVIISSLSLHLYATFIKTIQKLVYTVELLDAEPTPIVALVASVIDCEVICNILPLYIPPILQMN